MWELDRQELEFTAVLGRLNIDDAPQVAHRAALRARALLVYEEHQRRPEELGDWRQAIQQGRSIMRRPVVRFAAACMFVALFLTGWIQLHDEKQASAAFYEFANSLVSARSARFKMEVESPGQPGMKAEALFLAPARFRQTLPELITVSDMQVGKITTMRPEQKTAVVVNLVGRGEMRGSIDIFDRLRKMLDDKTRTDEAFQPIGEKEINGRRALGFREETPFAMLTIWGDPETGLPLRIETVMSGTPRMEVTWTDFELNIDLDESLFDTTPPADYKVQEFEMDASPYKEQDLIETFRLASEISDGTFPDSIDAAASQQLMVKSVRSRKDATDEQVMEKFMELGAKIGRGFSFVERLPKSADAHYAGQGVKRDTPDTPIFWYRPEGAKTYRVVYADLTIRDVATAPETPEAVPLSDSVPGPESNSSSDGAK